MTWAEFKARMGDSLCYLGFHKPHEEDTGKGWVKVTCQRPMCPWRRMKF